MSSEQEELQTLELPSGASVAVVSVCNQERIEIRAPDGLVELVIVRTAAGLSLQLSGERLSVEARHLAVRCDTLDVQATAQIRMQAPVVRTEASGEIQSVAQGDVHIEGAIIHLN